EIVVPDLRGVVEDPTLAREDDLFESLVRLGLALDELVQVGHVRLMMLSVVEFERLRADVRSERVPVVRERRKRKRHDMSPWVGTDEMLPPHGMSTVPS